MKPNWQQLPLGEIFDIARGGSPRPIDKFITTDPKGINWIMIGDATDGGKYISKTRKRIVKEGVKRSRMVKPGDFLLTNSMSFGRPYILNTSGCIHDGWLVLSPRGRNVHPDYFYHLLGSNLIYAEFQSRASGVTVKNLNIELVKGVEVPLPPLSEQKRIAAILDAADALREKRRQAIAKLDTLLQSVFLDMFGDPIANPKGYSSKRMIDIVDVDRPITYGILKPGPDQAKGINYVRVVDMKDGGIDLSGIKRTTAEISNSYKRSILRPDDLLLSIRGHVGRLALIPRELDGANITQDSARLAVAGANPYFVRECLRTQAFQNWMFKHTKGGAIKGINLGDVKQMPVVLPPPRLQKRFGEVAQTVEEQRQRLRGAREKESLLFHSLQQRAFRGEL